MSPLRHSREVEVVTWTEPVMIFFWLLYLLPILAHSGQGSNTYGQRAIALKEMKRILEQMVDAFETDNTSEFLAYTLAFRGNQTTMDDLCTPAPSAFTDFTCIDRRGVERKAVRLCEAALPSVKALQKRRLHTLTEYLQRLKFRIYQAQIDIGESNEAQGGSPTRTQMSSRIRAQKLYDETERVLTMVAHYVNQIRKYTMVFSIPDEDMKLITTREGETREVCNLILATRDSFLAFVKMFGGDSDEKGPFDATLETIHEVDDS